MRITNLPFELNAVLVLEPTWNWQLGAGEGGGGVSVGGRRLPHCTFKASRRARRRELRAGWAPALRPAESSALGVRIRLRIARQIPRRLSGQVSAGEAGAGTWEGGLRELPQRPSDLPCSSRVEMPDLSLGGVRGEDGSGTCTSLSTRFLLSGIGLCLLPSGAGIGLTFQNPGSLTSRGWAACFPKPRTR